MFAKEIVCVECEESYESDEKLFRCPKCGGSLDIVYDYDQIRPEIAKESFLKERPHHWKYWMFYPVNPSKKISLGEGGTPLLFSKIFSSKELKLNLKFEGVNPTGSFKDRGSTVEVTKARELNVWNACCASTGNMGASIAAYCGKARIGCKVFLPKHVSKNKVKQMVAHGAELMRVEGDYVQALKECEEFAKEENYYLMGDYPQRGEGEKSIGFEVAEQLNWEVPDYVICPMGNGTLIHAIWDAFNELKTVKLTDDLPKMIGIQADGCSPIVDAFNEGMKEVEPIKDVITMATAIECGDPIDGEKALKALRESKGIAEVVSDDNMERTLRLLAKGEGLFVEPAGAASLAGLLKLRKELKGTVVCVLTGHGLKDPVIQVFHKTSIFR